MSGRRQDWLGVAEARAGILSRLEPLAAERRPLAECLGSVLARDVRSPIDLPPWNNSGMDGFAVRAADIRGASAARPVVLPVVDDVPAGHQPRGPLRPGTSVRVMTGAPVPAGADSVVRVEHTDGGSDLDGPEARVRIDSDADAERNIRPRGEDLRSGELVLTRGAVIRAAEIGVAASVGQATLEVVRRPTVAIVTSGEELVDVESFAEVRAGRKIVSSNGYSLAAQVTEAGAVPRVLPIARDDPDDLRRVIGQADGCDVLITSAGISMGEHDHVLEALASLRTTVHFWRVRMRPGSPIAFGSVGALGSVPWFGLPGNPVSSMVTVEVFVRPALLRMSGRTRIFAPTLEVTVRGEYGAAPGLTHFPRVRLVPEGDDTVADLTGPQGSGILTSMARADALLVLREDAPAAGTGDRRRAIVLGGAPAQEVPDY